MASGAKLSGSKSDLAYAGIALIPLAIVYSFIDIHDFLGSWSEPFESIVGASAIVFAWYAWRRWREAHHELRLREHSESSLMLNHGRLMDLLEASSDRFFETDDQFRIIWRSRSGLPLTEDTGRYLGKTRWEAAGGSDITTAENWAALRDDMENHRPFRNFRETRLWKGSVAHRTLNGRPFYGANGKFLGYRCTVTDITKEVVAQEEAARIQAQFVNAIESIADGYSLWDKNHNLIMCNDHYMRPSGCTIPARCPGIDIEEFLSGVVRANEDSAPADSEHWIKTAIANHKSNAAITSQQAEIGDRWLEIINHHLADGNTLSVTRDITAQKELEQQLQRAQKLKAVGQLTGGIAHDFNNLLQVILGNIELIVERAEPNSKILEQARIAQSASERAADLIRRLLAFSRQQTLQPKAFEINEMVEEMGEIVKRTLGTDIEFRTQLGSDLSPVFLDRGQTEAAFLNLAVNARDAMPRGGSLFVETREVTFTEADIGDHFELLPGRYVLLTIADTGSGMPPEVLARAFEPFFTTKVVGKGTGLGLSMIYGFLKQSGGDVKIYSEIGEGTVVKLYLPITDATQPAEEMPVESVPLHIGSETILVVEDEAGVRDYTTRQLESLGYRVLTAVDGNDALETLKRINGQIDLLFTDVIMPSMNGHQLSEYVAALYPAIRILYTSGYNQNVAIHNGKASHQVAMIEKPYRKADLARKVREVLDNGRTDH